MRRAFPVLLILIPAAVAAEQITGLWLGTIEAGKVTLRTVLHVNRSAHGLTGSLDIIDQGSAGLPLNSITVEGKSVRFTLDRIVASFEGTLTENEMRGAWQQPNVSVPLIFKRTDHPPEIVRPQDPHPPYPYIEEEVRFHNFKAGIKFNGILTLPRSAGRHPAVMLVAAPGPLDHNGTFFGHKPFLILADHLTRNGIAVLRVDGRGTGRTGGAPNQGLRADFVQDTLAAVTFLKSRREIDARRIGLAGYHEGGLIATEAAAASADVRFLVLMAAPCLPGKQLLQMQAEIILKGMSMPPEILAAYHAVERIAFDVLAREGDYAMALRKIRELATAVPRAESVLPLLETQLNAPNVPLFRESLAYDPQPTLARVKAPVLVIHGERDLEIPSQPNLASARQTLESRGNADYQILPLAGLNHLFQTAPLGVRSEYAKIEETIAPAALEAVSTWIASHSNRPTGEPAR